MNWPIKDFGVNDVFLDSKNIRLPITDTSQDAILQDLFSNEDALEIVKSMAQFGLFPDEFPIVIKEKNKLIVLEGNRRLAALKAIDNPDRIPFFKEKIKSFKISRLKNFRAVLAPDRKAAIIHIANKHTITLRRPWRPLRQAYFYKSQLDNGKTIEQLNIEFTGQDIKKFIKMLEAHHLAKSIMYDDASVSELVHNERKFPITTLERMYDDSTCAGYLGLSFEPTGKAKIITKQGEFQTAFKRIVEDIALDKLNSRNTNKKEDRLDYINSLPPDLKPTKNSKALASKNFKPVKVEIDKSEKNKKKTKIQKGLIPSWLTYNLQHSGLKDVYTELRNIPVVTYPNAAHDLLRSFLECTVINYLKETGEYKHVEKNSEHNPKLAEMLNFIISPKCKSIDDFNLKSSLEQIKKNYTEPYSLVRQNMINHNEHCVSTPQEVRIAWNKLEPLMKYLLNPRKNEESSKVSK